MKCVLVLTGLLCLSVPAFSDASEVHDRYCEGDGVFEQQELHS